MSKVFVIPDIHLKPWMIEEADRLISGASYDHIVFLGDVVDDWNQEENLELYRETFDVIASFMLKHENVRFCYGNHDMSYVWEANESGYSPIAREEVVEGIQRLENLLPQGRIAYVHRIDDVIFSHAGLTLGFIKEYYDIGQDPSSYDVDYVIGSINKMGRRELWQGDSPIWARPQGGFDESFTTRYLQVVGHTPVRNPYENNGFLTLDTFSTTSSGDPIGNERFVIIDTLEKTWRYADQVSL